MSTPKEVKVGQVFRMVSKVAQKFSDCYVADIRDDVAYLKRPMIIASTGEADYELFTVYVSSLQDSKIFKLVAVK